MLCHLTLSMTVKAPYTPASALLPDLLRYHAFANITKLVRLRQPFPSLRAPPHPILRRYCAPAPPNFFLLSALCTA
ncbi:hypothetical protein HHX47_DHR2000012 [Lentinula edodes]|nr:hypothetical protein HHX47_DHR2000012 [Lentinula edodes]